MCEVDLERVLSRMLVMMPPPISTGIRTVEMMKALVRTRSRYSRLAMSQTLCMGSLRS